MIHNLIGGGAGLNFTVKGGTQQPENPRENTIWVNTATQVTKWVISASQPAAPVEGLVWLSIGETSETPLDAVKNDSILLCLRAVSQYVNAAWKDKPAMIFQTGEWKELVSRTYLFSNGDEYDVLTGGWDGDGAINSAGLMVFSSAVDELCGLSTMQKLSRGKATKLCVNITSGSISGAADFNIVLNDTYESTDDGDVFTCLATTTVGQKSLDISKITAKFYVYVYSYSKATFKVDKIWME